MATTHTEPVLNKVSKSELVQLVLQTEAKFASQIANLTSEVKLRYFKKLEADLAVTKNVNSKTCGDTVEVIDIPSSVREQDLEGKLRNIFE